MKINKDYFSRLFVLAKINKVNLRSFSNMLFKYDDLILCYENEVPSLLDLFNKITGLYVQKDQSFGIFDDAYWCGTAYFYLREKTRKPLEYILLKLPLDQLIDLYPLYHEMDYSSLLEEFNKIEKEQTILKLIFETYHVNMVKLSKDINISLNTIKYYRQNDENLYSASFDKIYHLANYFNLPLKLFLKEDNAKKTGII